MSLVCATESEQWFGLGPGYVLFCVERFGIRTVDPGAAHDVKQMTSISFHQIWSSEICIHFTAFSDEDLVFTNRELRRYESISTSATKRA